MSTARGMARSVAARSGERHTNDLAPSHASQVTLLDLLDRLLAGGVVLQGEITLAAADIDLVQIDLGLLVASIDKAVGR